MKRLLAIGACMLLAACQAGFLPSSGPRATANLQPTRGNSAAAQATFQQRGDKVRVVVQAQGLKPGREHGFHIHEAGDCSSGDGMSAKGHFNPTGKPHGNPSSAERHAGDLPALKADAQGRATLEVAVDGISVGPGPASIIGRGLIIHADPDDFKTQPTGNSGARIACGVITAG